MQRLFNPLVYVAVPLAAFITFMLQPVAGKLLMPVYGGSAGTWLTLSMFFQGALLGGYAFSWWGLERLHARLPWVVAALALLAAASLRLPLWLFPCQSEWLGVLLALTTSLLPAVLFTTAFGLILQGWLQPDSGRIPFFLYAFSNVGSTLALLAYPFVIEPRLGLHRQILIIKILLWCLAALALALCHIKARVLPPEPAPAPSCDEKPSRDTASAWFILSFATCTLMLGAIPILSAEYGSNPLTWVLPLGLYLLSFSLTFSGWWPSSANYVAMVVLGAALFGFMELVGIGPNYLSNWGRIWLALILLAGCLGGQGFLYQLRPAKRPSRFYVILALGGFAAGLFVSALAPLLFDRAVEFTAAAFFLLVFLALQLLGRPEALPRFSLALLILLPSAGLVFFQLARERDGEAKTVYFRNTYSTLVVKQYATWLSLSNESTLHGEQFIEKANRRRPTSYYTRGSAAGIVLNAVQSAKPATRIGVIGLGAGTLAAYGRKDDHIVFWDINPLAIQLAQTWFSFLRDSAASIDIRPCDGRLGMRRSQEKFDVIILDAFAGDSVPAHLITREAVTDYLDHLDHGLLLVHISSRYFDLFPVIAGSARRPGWNCLYVNSWPHDAAKLNLLANSTSDAVIFPSDREAEVLQWFDAFRSDPDYAVSIDLAPDEPTVLWTDDRSAIMDILPWDRLLYR